MKSLNKRDPRDLQYAREQKAAKVAILRKALSRPSVQPDVAKAWERTIQLIEDDIHQIDQHLAGIK